MATSPSPATLINRLFTSVALVLTLYMVYRAYQLFVAYGKLRQENNYYKTENFYRTVADSIRRTLPPLPPPPSPVIVYRISPLSSQAAQALAAAVTSRVRLDMQRELRAATERLAASSRPTLRLPQAKAVVALKDTTIRRRSVTTGRVITTAAKTGTFRDPWLRLTGVVIPGQPGRQDSLQVKYQLRLDFSARAYSKRTATHWWQWWKRRRVYVDLQNNNPNTTTTKLEGLPVQKR
jgi:hypothetical protein